MTRQEIPEAALALHRSALVIDGHADTPQRLLDDGYDLAAPLDGGHLNLDSARAGGLGAEFFVAWVDPRRFPGQFAQRTLELIHSVHKSVAAHPSAILLATSPEDIERAHREQKLAILLAVEGGHSIEDSLDRLREYHRLGVRYMTLTWANSNGWADSSGDIDDPAVEHTADGLSAFGAEVIHEMNRLGMMVDISHVSDPTFWRVLETSQAPVFASHSSARALTSAPRNLTDEMLVAIADCGGLTMVNFYSAFISETWKTAWNALRPELEVDYNRQTALWKAEGKPITCAMLSALDRQWAAKIARPPLSVLIDHIDHIAKVAGIDHVGLGSDFDGIPSLVEGIESAADLPKITAALMARGYSGEDCRKILGLNFLRFFREVQATAEDGRAG
ncbi:MAG: dipeptidase [Acidobacteriaceae bacterium]